MRACMEWANIELGKSLLRLDCVHFGPRSLILLAILLWAQAFLIKLRKYVGRGHGRTAYRSCCPELSLGTCAYRELLLRSARV